MNALFAYFSDAIAACKKRYIKTLVFAAFIIVGIVCGFLLRKNDPVRTYYATYCRKYAESIFLSSVLKIALKRFFSSFVLFLLVSPNFLTPFYLPFCAFVLFFKGYSFGVSGSILLFSYGVNGAFAWLLCALPTAIICFFIAANVAAVAAAPKKRLCLYPTDETCKYACFLAFLAVVCALVECIFVFLLFRPISKIF